MSRTIALIASLDTKEPEIKFLMQRISEAGHQCCIIDTGARPSSVIHSCRDACAIARAAGVHWSDPYSVPKHEMIDTLIRGIPSVILELYGTGVIHGVLAIGGLQNTLIAVSAMVALPLGVPKVMVSTVASGRRTFESICGTSDIMTIPSIADFCGSNLITDAILSNAAAAVIGMAEHAGKAVIQPKGLLIGATLMGVVDTGAARAVSLLQEQGYQVVSFHSTGVGGRTLDGLIRQKMVSAVMEFSPHELVGELMGGYSAASGERLTAAGSEGIPQLFIPGALDFIDYHPSELPAHMKGRKHIYHNSELVHVKLSREEILQVGRLTARRLNQSTGPVTCLIPLQGFRQGGRAGEPLQDPAIDRALILLLKELLKPPVRIIEVDANINDEEFSRIAVQEMIRMVS